MTRRRASNSCAPPRLRVGDSHVNDLPVVVARAARVEEETARWQLRVGSCRRLPGRSRLPIFIAMIGKDEVAQVKQILRDQAMASLYLTCRGHSPLSALDWHPGAVTLECDAVRERVAPDARQWFDVIGDDTT